MSSRTCAYVASKSDPESWYGTESSTFYLDEHPKRGGLGITKWHCPHPPLDRDDGSDDDGDNQYCVFHTDPADVPDDVDEREALLGALQDAGNGPRSDRPEHRGQFVGATLGAIDLSTETIAATDHHDIRFDHARFQSDDANLDFSETTFVAEGPMFVAGGQHIISFAGTEFIATGEGQVLFHDATFRTDGVGAVIFRDATFRTGGEGDVRFDGATFRTDGLGNVKFNDATFRTDGKGRVLFSDARFRSDGEGYMTFYNATFRTDGEGDVAFYDATFRADDEGDVRFDGATFRADGEGDVWFDNATFRADDEGDVRFRDASLLNADFRLVEFAEADFGGADFTGSDLREANVADIFVNGATTCERLYEGYRDDRSTGRLSVPARLRRLPEGSEFDSEAWDATARAYHQLKTVFSEHGLVGRARKMHVRERRARSLEAKAKAANGWFDRRYLRSLPSRVFTGYGVGVRNLVIWMIMLFSVSTAVYVIAGVEDTFWNNISYSVLAFTVAPPGIPERVGVQLVMMVETFFGTLSIVLLGYILGNRERF